MTYTVIWLPDAEQALAALWLAASDKAAVSASARAMDVPLKRDPHLVGESRDDYLRILLMEPLGILFRVVQEDRLVQVVHVWAYGRGKQS